jgi:hypothetical protein
MPEVTAPEATASARRRIEGGPQHRQGQRRGEGHGAQEVARRGLQRIARALPRSEYTPQAMPATHQRGAVRRRRRDAGQEQAEQAAERAGDAEQLPARQPVAAPEA